MMFVIVCRFACLLFSFSVTSRISFRCYYCAFAVKFWLPHGSSDGDCADYKLCVCLCVVRRRGVSTVVGWWVLSVVDRVTDSDDGDGEFATKQGLAATG